mgnify:CR=1 FL=1
MLSRIDCIHQEIQLGESQGDFQYFNIVSLIGWYICIVNSFVTYTDYCLILWQQMCRSVCIWWCNEFKFCFVNFLDLLLFLQTSLLSHKSTALSSKFKLHFCGLFDSNRVFYSFWKDTYKGFRWRLVHTSESNSDSKSDILGLEWDHSF